MENKVFILTRVSFCCVMELFCIISFCGQRDTFLNWLCNWSALTYPSFQVFAIHTCVNSNVKMRWSTIIYEQHVYSCL